MPELTKDEQSFILLQAQLAKTNQHLEGIRTRAAALFYSHSQGGITTVTYGGGPSPDFKAFSVEIDLMAMKPGQFSRIAQQLDAILAELAEASKEFASLTMELRDLQSRVQGLRVNVTFE